MLSRWNDFGALGRFAPRELTRSLDTLDELRRESAANRPRRIDVRAA